MQRLYENNFSDILFQKWILNFKFKEISFILIWVLLLFYSKEMVFNIVWNAVPISRHLTEDFAEDPPENPSSLVAANTFESVSSPTEPSAPSPPPPPPPDPSPVPLPAFLAPQQQSAPIISLSRVGSNVKIFRQKILNVFTTDISNNKWNSFSNSYEFIKKFII